jgi:hypothetical protein
MTGEMGRTEVFDDLADPTTPKCVLLLGLFLCEIMNCIFV